MTLTAAPETRLCNLANYLKYLNNKIGRIYLVTLSICISFLLLKFLQKAMCNMNTEFCFSVSEMLSRLAYFDLNNVIKFI